MNKREFQFISEFFIPECKDFKLKEIEICDIKQKIKNKKIIPIKYESPLNSIAFIVMESNLDKELPAIQKGFEKGIANISKIIFKQLKCSMLSPIDTIKFSNKNYINLLLEYNFSNQFNFYTVVPLLFLKNFYRTVFKQPVREEIKTIEQLLKEIKYNFFRENFGSFWSIKDLVNMLNSKDLQILLNTLLKLNIIEETMLTAFVASFSGTEVEKKILSNLSKNMRNEVLKNLKENFPDKRWIEEVTYLIKAGIETLLLENKLKIKEMEFLFKLKNKLKLEYYRKVFLNKPFTDYLEEAHQRKVIEQLMKKVRRNILARSLVNLNEKYINLFTSKLRTQGAKEFIEDVKYQSEISTKEDILKAQIEVIENLKEIYYDKIASRIDKFEDVITSLSPEDLKLLIEEYGITGFAQATINLPKKIKQYIYISINGVMRNLLIDIYSGKIRFKENFGEMTINKNRKNILKCYLYLKNVGRIKSGKDLS